MYCRYCGKSIEDDSLFCKSCGKNVSTGTSASQGKEASVKSCWLFQRRRNAVLVYLYCVYVLGWIFYLIAICHSSRRLEEGYASFFFFVIFIPFIIVGGWRICKLKSAKSKTVADKDLNVTNKMDTIQPQPIHEQPQQVNLNKGTKSVPTIVFSELLLAFARANGKMRVVNKKINENEYERYCQFISPDGGVIRVEFSDRVASLSPQEISEKKHLLCVNKTSDGKYILDFIEDNQTEDILPL